MLEGLWGDGESQQPRKKTKHWGRRIIAIVVALVCVVAVGAGGYLLFLDHTVASKVHRQTLLPEPDASTPPRLDEAAGAENVLLIGSDGRPGLAGQRSDVMMLMHVSADKQRVSLVHFPRDLYVDIPGHGKNKLNAAFAFGGAPLLVRTLQGLVALPIDHVAIIGFEGFERMTDALGGLDVYAVEPSAGVAPGMNHLNGAQALAFVRERHQLSEGDISRGRRQQAFLKALILKGLSKDVVTNPVRLARFIEAGASNLTVDQSYTMSKMRSDALAMRGLRGSDIQFVTAPYKGFGRSPQGASIDILDVAGMQRLSTALRTDSMRAYQP